MRWLRRAPTTAPWTLHGVARPWTGPSILGYLGGGLDPDGRLRDDHLVLPDEPPDTGQLRWAPGALDGVMTSHVSRPDADPGTDPAAAVVLAVTALTDRADAASLTAAVEALRTTDLLASVDDILRALAGSSDEAHGERVGQIARLLTAEAPERQLVKAGIAFTGVFGDLAADRPTLDIVGAHEEFTLFVAVALTNLGAGERALWELAKRVDGWGRIQLVRRLAGTTDPAIRAWMLRDGFRNSVMDEYLAGTCAVSGGLLEALSPDDIDDELFDGASDMLGALARGGPAEDLSDYADGRAAVARWLDHVESRGFSLRSIAALDDLAAVPLPDDLSNRIETMRRSLDAEAVIREALESDDSQTFATAAQAANRRGIDTTDRLLQRAAAGDRYATFELFRLVDEARIDAALDVMRGRLDLEALGSGPARELGLGEAFRDQFDLESVVSGLARFPGRGSAFILAALRSPVIRSRNTAIRTIRTWGVDFETPEIRAALERAQTIEPDDRVRAAIAAALAGEPLETP